MVIEVEVVQMNKELKRLEKKFSFQHQYPPTKIMWVPDLSNSYPDIMVTSGDALRVWSVEDNKRAECKIQLNGVG